MQKCDNAAIGENTIMEDGMNVGRKYYPDCGKLIIGKLIPAGSGLMAYRDYQPGITPEPRVVEETIEDEAI